MKRYVLMEEVSVSLSWFHDKAFVCLLIFSMKKQKPSVVSGPLPSMASGETSDASATGPGYLVFLKALIESFQNQVSLLDLEQVVINAVD